MAASPKAGPPGKKKKKKFKVKKGKGKKKSGHTEEANGPGLHYRHDTAEKLMSNQIEEEKVNHQFPHQQHNPTEDKWEIREDMSASMKDFVEQKRRLQSNNKMIIGFKPPTSIFEFLC